MAQNWIRAYELEAGQAGGTGFKITDLKIEFSLTKTEDETANDITLSIWNLNDEHIAELEKKDCVVTLKAGYVGNIKQIFVGYVCFIEGEPDGADWKTTLTIVDGRVETRDTQVSTSYDSGTSSKTIIDDIAKEMGISVTYGDDVTHCEMPSGYSFVGDAATSLDKVCDVAGLSWSIQDGKLEIKKNKGTMNKTGYVLSAETGLISTAKKVRMSTENTTDNDEYGWEVEYLMNADIKISDYVYLKTKRVTGYFRVSQITMGGSNWDGDWVCKATLLNDS